MKKLLLSVLLVTCLLAGVASAALAAGNPPGNKGKRQIPFNLVGTITSVEGSVVKVKVAAGNRVVKDLVGSEVALQTNEGTRFMLRGEDGETVLITLADLKAGQNVSAGGKLAKDVWITTRLTVGVANAHLP